MKINLRTNSLTIKWAPFTVVLMFMFATVFAQPTHALSIFNAVKCNALTLFASASTTTLQVSRAAMEQTFQLELSVMQGAWELEDLAVNALRTVGESAFTITLNAFANRPGIFIKNTEYRTNALQEFKDTSLNSLHVHQVNIDAAKASYREDMLALVRAHQKLLTDLVDNLIGSINNALVAAKANCSAAGVVATLVAVIAQAGITLTAQGLLEDARSFAKALVIVTTRNTQFIQEAAEFTGESATATIKLAAAFLTRQ